MAARTGGAGLPSAFTPAAWCFGIFQKTGKDMDHGILFDHARTARIGLPEAVFCEGKPFEALVELLSRFGRGSGHPVLFTRLAADVFARVPAEIRAGYDYHPLSRTAFGDALPPKGKGRVAVISAGTADGFVAWEAARTLAYLGIGHKLFEDCGVAGLWRLAERLEEINTFDAVIVVAGLDAALVSVMGGLTPKPIFGVPTTAGTASETTINYVVTDTANKRKFVAVDPHDIPIVAFVDPNLTDSMPRGLKVATGLDALTHAIEGYITPGAWSLSDCLSMQTIRMIAKNLAKSADGDVPAGEQMAYASYITGMAYSNVGLGLVHGMAHPLGGRLGVAHGVANGILLAPVMEYNKDFTGEKYRDIADAFGVEDAYTGDLETVREEAVQAVHKLTVDLKNPTTISEVGATEADLEALAHDAFNDVCTPGNPRQATEEDILAIYKSLM